MSDKFLGTGGGATNLSNGTANIYAGTLGAAGLDPSQPVKTNSLRQLISSKLSISDIDNLTGVLSNIITNPFNGTFKATDLETDDYFSVNAELQKTDNFTASTATDTNITGIIKVPEIATGTIYDSTQSTFIELDGATVIVSAGDLTLNGSSVITELGGKNLDTTLTTTQTSFTQDQELVSKKYVGDTILPLETQLQNVFAVGGVTTFSGEIDCTKFSNAINSSYLEMFDGETVLKANDYIEINSINSGIGIRADQAYVNINAPVVTTAQTVFNADNHIINKKYADDLAEPLTTKLQNITAVSGVTTITGRIQTNTVAIGSEAGQTTQGTSAVAIGLKAGNTNQGYSSIAIGRFAGFTNQPASSIILNATSFTLDATTTGFFVKPLRELTASNQLFYEATTGEISYGEDTRLQNITAVSGVTTIIGRIQTDTKVAIGRDAGLTNQGVYTIAIGVDAGKTNQSQNGIAIGPSSGETYQGSTAIAIGNNAGNDTQGSSTVAIGLKAGQFSQINSAVAIGNQAGNTNQGYSSVAIGRNAGFNNQFASSIILNGTGSVLDATTTGFFVKPLRALAAANPMYYNSTTGEISYVNSSIKFKTNVVNITKDTSKVYDLVCREYNYIKPLVIEYDNEGNPIEQLEQKEVEYDPFTSIGFIAEEVNAIDPYLSVVGADGPINIDWNVVTTYLVSELKKLRDRVAVLESR